MYLYIYKIIQALHHASIPFIMAFITNIIITSPSCVVYLHANYKTDVVLLKVSANLIKSKNIKNDRL